MNLRTVGLAAALLAAACGEDVSFPATPPHDLAAELRERAGKGAIDCGVARGRASRDAVYACASRALRARRPFFCRYDFGPIIDSPRVGDAVPIGATVLAPTAYIGTSEGVVLGLARQPAGGIVTWQMLSPADRDGKPKRMTAPMTPPSVLRGGSIRTGKDHISGIVIVEAIIDVRGTVADARVLKPLPEGLDTQAVELVKQASFEPARFFGVPQAVYFNVTINVERGVITLP